ncbi:MAG: SPFH domain-containing protein [Candidatus Pacebacteria bacterium]|jgi:regulator of protease activity HflC (stomatin/prohibitin superfamily)|nr:SPFH domain-containing protein [Candidatus Paceibacterota bacterium]
MDVLSWILLLATTVFAWWWSGWHKIAVGWKGLKLLLGVRTEDEVKEGWRWAAWPWSIIQVDCRQKVTKLKPIIVMTENNVAVTINGSIMSRVTNLNSNFNIKPEEIRKGLDDVWDEIIRRQVFGKSLRDALDMQVDLGVAATSYLRGHAAELNWGITIDKVVVASILPDEAMLVALQQKQKEESDRDAQKVELKHVGERVMELMQLPPGGPGYTREQAIEEVQMSVHGIKKNVDVKSLGLDANMMAIVMAFLEKWKEK